MGKRSGVGATILTIYACTCAVVVRARAAPGVDEATRAAARDIGYTGVDAYQRGDYAMAHERLEKAYAILHAPSLGLWSARAMVKLGQMVEAGERLREVSRLPTSVGDELVQARARNDAAAEAAALAARLPRLVVRVESAPGVTPNVTLDGAPLVSQLWGESRPINPGRHVVRGVAGAAKGEETVELAESEHKGVTLRLVAGSGGMIEKIASAPAAEPQLVPAPAGNSQGAGTAQRRWLGWGALTAGGIGLAAGAIAGGMAWSEKSDLSRNPLCDGSMRCDPAVDIEGYNRLRTLSTIAFIAGAALAATGAILLYLGPSSAATGGRAVSSEALTFVVLPGAAAFRARF